MSIDTNPSQTQGNDQNGETHAGAVSPDQLQTRRTQTHLSFIRWCNSNGLPYYSEFSTRHAITRVGPPTQNQPNTPDPNADIEQARLEFAKWLADHGQISEK